MNEALRERKMDYASKLNTFKMEWVLNFAYSGLIFSLLYVIDIVILVHSSILLLQKYLYRSTILLSVNFIFYHRPKNKAVFK